MLVAQKLKAIALILLFLVNAPSFLEGTTKTDLKGAKFVRNNQQIWTAYSFNNFYRSLKESCPQIACYKKTRDGRTQDILAIYFSTLNNDEVNQLMMDSEYEIHHSSVDFVVSDFKRRFCQMENAYLTRNAGMVQQIVKYHDKVQAEW
jgi:hypothetical protein